MLEKKDYVSVSKEYINKNCNLQEIYTAFKEKHPNVNIGFSKFCVLVGSIMTHSVCVHSARQNIVLLVNAMDCDIQRPDQINFVLP